MSPPPANPRIYHITHVNNLPAIIAHGSLISDAAMIARGGPIAAIGMGNIKQRRLSLPVSCHPGLNVGDFVPFYFCPRSIMLFVIHCANNPELAYRGGQGPIVHLEADLGAVVAWANQHQRAWAFSLSNAGAGYAQFRNSLTQLADIDWDAIASTNFSNGSYTPSGNQVKERKQAEFLLHGAFPWSLVQRVGVASHAIASQARAAMANAAHQPDVSVQPSWYF
ncbi:type II toxin-antitoxin system toxin DNA ADP-ribosyl transferase DarT [Sorangium sp. So ce854]|uniref:type II toxin-antitoxin system toxin DNA ADP-ribosyl transferase DarT n=1 Tax=Sorangium sp. So ce854 TaxID=3133322 RepID=UPI003F5F213A